jgi:hypothetical protein
MLKLRLSSLGEELQSKSAMIFPGAGVDSSRVQILLFYALTMV